MLNDYTSSYSDMLEVVKRSMLCVSRFKNRAIETFKNVKGLNPKYEVSFLQPKVNTISFGINSCTYQGSKIWNNPPQGVKDTTCLIACKDLIIKWDGPTCKCGLCIV